MIHRTPAALEVEKHVIGAGFLSPDSLSTICQRLTDADFHDPRHKAILSGFQAGLLSGGVLDIWAIGETLRASGRLQDAGGDQYLRDVSNEIVSDAGLDGHIRILKDYGTRRQLIQALGSAMESAYDPEITVSDAVDAAESAVLMVGDSRKAGPELKAMSRVLASTSLQWEETVSGKPSGIMSKIPAVDELIGGFRPGKLYILAARPGLGKSMLALQIATQCGEPVAHYSAEMLAEEQAERMISQQCDLNSDSLRSAKVLTAQAHLLSGVTKDLANMPIWFCDDGPVTTPLILSHLRRMKGKIRLVVVDYLQLMGVVGKFQSRELEVGNISKGLKAISLKMKIPVLAIASLSRKPEERTDKRPLLSDLRESGNIESDADGVLYLYRESDYSESAKKDFPNVTELILAKNRGGKRGRALLDFDGAHSKFYGLHPDDQKRYLAMLSGKSQPKKGKGDFYGDAER